MNMVGHSPNNNWYPTDMFNNPANISENLFQVFRAHLHTRTLYMEYEVDVDFY